MRAGSGSKQKGSAFERKVCVELSLWLTSGQKKDCFWRSAMSGGRATVAHKKNDDLARQAGDISATSVEGHALTDEIFLELKHCKNLKIDHFLFGQGPLAAIWRTAKTQASRHKRQAVLIIWTNRLPIIVVTERNGPFNDYKLSSVIDIKTSLPCKIFFWNDLLKLPYKGIKV